MIKNYHTFFHFSYLGQGLMSARFSLLSDNRNPGMFVQHFFLIFFCTFTIKVYWMPGFLNISRYIFFQLMYWTQPFLPVHACQTISLENSDLDHINIKLGKLSQMLVFLFILFFVLNMMNKLKLRNYMV